jgi:hypothetical protein
MKEDNDRVWRSSGSGRAENVRENFTFGPLGVDIGRGVLEEFPVPRFANRRHFLQNLAHENNSRRSQPLCDAICLL